MPWPSLQRLSLGGKAGRSSRGVALRTQNFSSLSDDFDDSLSFQALHFSERCLPQRGGLPSTCEATARNGSRLFRAVRTTRPDVFVDVGCACRRPAWSLRFLSLSRADTHSASNQEKRQGFSFHCLGSFQHGILAASPAPWTIWPCARAK